MMDLDGPGGIEYRGIVVEAGPREDQVRSSGIDAGREGHCIPAREPDPPVVDGTGWARDLVHDRLVGVAPGRRVLPHERRCVEIEALDRIRDDLPLLRLARQRAPLVELARVGETGRSVTGPTAEPRAASPFRAFSTTSSRATRSLKA